MWYKYVTRRLATQVAQAWNFGWGDAMEKVYKVSVKNTLVFRDQNKTEYYVDLAQHKKYVFYLYKLLKNPRFIKSFHQQAQEELENILEDTQKIFGDKNFSKLSNNELLKIYEDFVLPNVEQFYIRMWMVFNIGEPLANTVKKRLTKYISPEKVDGYLLTLSSPLLPNDVLNERSDLLKIAAQKDKLTAGRLKTKIKKHTAKYQHIPMFDFDHDPYNEKHFFDEFLKIINPQKELRELKELFASRKKDFNKILNNLKLDKQFIYLLKFLKENVYLRDYRDMIRQKLNLELRSFYLEIGKRLALSIDEVATLTNKEIIFCLSKNVKFSKQEVQKRELSYLLIQKGNKYKIYSGQDAISRANKELKFEKIKKVKVVKGIVGSSGRARGRAKIVYTNKDLHKVKKGDVLVSTMTRQDFVVAIRKSVALVTDEGSVTAHAAIIARELKIPCIVAAKIATKVFKDGDLLEVDAYNGIVTKLE
ncbi:MAG: PEP-utilizing enzyme [Candidatus Buchananbacteria bacterium]